MSRNSSTIAKSELRRVALERRDALDAEVRAAASLAICRAISEDDMFLDARGIHVYLPIGSEVDITPLVQLAWEMGKDVGMMQVMEDGGIAQYAITPATTYVRSALGIREPVDAEPFDMNVCDLVIVPLVAADERCNRLGYGKGYYDQFLAHNPRPTIGAAFEEQIFPSLPVDDLDIMIDGIYTQERFIPGE